jgi:hypothetical protein
MPLLQLGCQDDAIQEEANCGRIMKHHNANDSASALTLLIALFLLPSQSIAEVMQKYCTASTSNQLDQPIIRMKKPPHPWLQSQVVGSRRRSDMPYLPPRP